jgi:hypothetical protein
MRKVPLLAIAVAVSILGVGCARSSDPSGSAPAPQDVLFVRNDRSVTLVRDLPDGDAVRMSGAVPALDWSAVVQASVDDRVTSVTAVDTSSGKELWAEDVPGTFDAKVASSDARYVALGPPGDGTGYPIGRTTTPLVVLRADGSGPSTYQLEGNYEPEAFSSDGKSLFVIEYLPPRNPTSYQVRRLELTTGEVVGVYTPHEELQEAMEGTARIQAASPDGRRLYTLYSFRDAQGTPHAFIHVLDLRDLWAHCINLPGSFATSPQKAMAITVAPSGDTVYVADAAADVVAQVDTRSLSVARTSDVDFGVSGFPAQVAVGSNDVLYVSSGTRLLAVDPATLTQRRTWYMTEDITGLQPANDGRRLYVGLKDQIVMIDTASGQEVGTLTPADLGRIGQLGQTTRLPGEPPSDFTCAC